MSIHIDVYVEENFHLNILGNVPSKGSHLWSLHMLDPNLIMLGLFVVMKIA
jgi:hypothetical protein